MKLPLNKAGILVKTVGHHGAVRLYRKMSLRRFRSLCKRDNWKSVEIYVSYGARKDYRGKQVQFYNDGIYTDPHEALLAYQAFTEEGVS